MNASARAAARARFEHSGSAALALGLLFVAVGVALARTNGVDVASLAVVVTVPLLAAGAAIALARACRLDRWLTVPEADPLGAMDRVLDCARRCRADGPASLSASLSGPDRLMADGLRLLIAGAEPGLIRNVMDRRLDAALARLSRRQVFLSVAARVGPLVAIPLLAAAAVAMIVSGADALRAPAAAALGACTLLVLPFAALAGPARRAGGRLVAARALAGLVVIEGVLAIRRGEDPGLAQRRLSLLLPPDFLTRPAAAA